MRDTSRDDSGGGEQEAGRVLDLWEQIRSDLQRAINAGTYPPGSRLPTMREIAARPGYQCSDKPVRRALKQLVDDGSLLPAGKGGRYTVPDPGDLSQLVTDHERRIRRLEERG